MTELEFESTVCYFFENTLGYQPLDLPVWKANQLVYFPSYLKFVQTHYAQDWARLCEAIGNVAAARSQLENGLLTHIRGFVRNATLPPHSKFRVHGISFKVYAEQATSNLYEYARQTTVEFAEASDLQLRPDILILVNGLPISLLELKFEPSGQTAKTQGVAQLINNYRAITHRSQGSTVSFYDRLAHVMAVDSNSVHVCRQLGESAAAKVHPRDYYFEDYSREMLRLSYAKGQGESLVQHSLRMLFQKDSLRRELGSLNRESKRKSDTAPTVRVPRMCQKIAIEMALKDLLESIETFKTSSSTHARPVNALLELATGAGKSDIVAVLVGVASTLDYFDKIVIVTDRLDLKRQLEESVNKIAQTTLPLPIAAPTNGAALQQLVRNNVKGQIILTTIQSLGREVEGTPSRKGLKTFILIDEAHRSHRGDNHLKMIQKLTNAHHADSVSYILGLTATPLLDTRERFKLLYQYGFDVAIKDGLILSPSTHMYDCQLRPASDMTEEEAKQIYREPRRIELVNQHIIQTFKLQLAQGIRPKALLCCTEIMTAEAQYDSLIRMVKADPELKAMPMYLHHSKDSRKGAQILSADELIKEFKSEDFGIAVVVDKLQTGYDDPALNTLLLNKLVKDVGAIQAVNRVTRRHPGKESCLIISYADQGGVSAIKEAFAAHQCYLEEPPAFSAISLQDLEEQQDLLLQEEALEYFMEHGTLDYTLLEEEHARVLAKSVRAHVAVYTQYYLSHPEANMLQWDHSWTSTLKRFLNALQGYLDDDNLLLEHIDCSTGKDFVLEGLFNGEGGPEAEVVDITETQEVVEALTQTPSAQRTPDFEEKVQEPLDEWHSYNFLDGVIAYRNSYFSSLFTYVALKNATLLQKLRVLQEQAFPCVDAETTEALKQCEQAVKTLFENGSPSAQEYVNRMGNYHIAESPLLVKEFLAFVGTPGKSTPSQATSQG